MTDDWVEVLHALLDAGARFLVVGAHALAVYGGAGWRRSARRSIPCG